MNNSNTRQVMPPFFKKPSGYNEINLPFGISKGRPELAGPDKNANFKFSFYKCKLNTSVKGFIWFGKGSEGPPNYTHGGMSAFLLDELMGTTAWVNDHQVVARNINFELFEMVPIYSTLSVQSDIIKVEGKKVYVKCSLTLNEVVLIKGSGLFLHLSDDKIEYFKSLVDR